MSKDIFWQELSVKQSDRTIIKGHRPHCVWFTGLSGAGKTTVANMFERRLLKQGVHTILLDGDNLRHGLNKDLGFGEADRGENIRRVAEVSRIMFDAGLVVIASLISPFSSDRQMARELFSQGDFTEVFVDTPLAECQLRDPKNLYEKARNGQLKNMTGLGSRYEVPVSPEVVIDTINLSADCSSELLFNEIKNKILL